MKLPVMIYILDGETIQVKCSAHGLEVVYICSWGDGPFYGQIYRSSVRLEVLETLRLIGRGNIVLAATVRVV